MKNYIYILLFMFSTSVFGQQNTSPSLLSCAGGSMEGWGLTSLKMDFSIGEVVINTGFANDFIISQGFHQENIHVVALKEELDIELTIFPNPTSSQINVDLMAVNDFPLEITIFDVSGKQWGLTDFIYNKKIHNMSLQGLAEGVYFLYVKNKNFKNIYKIQKTK